ncbi:hypothetical protein [Stella sp.]|uniref:hypothetical protein n=1 Tax=Stella sp. TaxID=2912054 RepID=UPI0035B32032
MADEKKTQRTIAGGSGRHGGDASRSPRNFFDEWVDRRLKTMHDAVLEEKIPEDMLRMLLGDAPAEPNNAERGMNDDANRPRSQGEPDADRERRR